MVNPIIADLILAHERTITDGNWVEPLNPLIADIPWAEAFWKPSPEEYSVAEIAAHLSIWADWVTGFFGGTDVDVEEVLASKKQKPTLCGGVRRYRTQGQRRLFDPQSLWPLAGISPLAFPQPVSLPPQWHCAECWYH